MENPQTTPKKRGRPSLGLTPDQKRAAERVRLREYYRTHKEQVLAKRKTEYLAQKAN
jgi:hypothetical protein